MRDDETTVIGFSRDWDVVQLGVEPAVQVTAVNHYFGTGETRKQALTDSTVTLLPARW